MTLRTSSSYEKFNTQKDYSECKEAQITSNLWKTDKIEE